MASTSEFLDDPRFSQTFEIPPNPVEGRLKPFRVKYADYGYRNEAHPEEENVFLFFSSMVGSRLVHVAKDVIAKRHKVRILNPDRPGFGGTDGVEVERAMKTWRETVVALLKHLRIRHVSVGCHSGGTIFALDLLLHHPEVLDPKRPFLAIGAPWILPLHTSSTMMAALQALPAGILRHTDKFARLINNHIGPTVGFCLGLCQAVVAKVTPKTPKTSQERLAAAESRPADSSPAETEGAKLEDDLYPEIIERIYAEGVQGISSDTLLFLQKTKVTSGWSDWGDYDALVPRLAETLRAAGRRLRVEVFFAENDALIGGGDTKGPRWFDQCWEAAKSDDTVGYRSTIVKGADHDGIWSLRWEAVKTVFEIIGSSGEETSS